MNKICNQCSREMIEGFRGIALVWVCPYCEGDNESEHIQALNDILAIAVAACDANTYLSHCLAMGAIRGKCEIHLEQHKQAQQPEHPGYQR